MKVTPKAPETLAAAGAPTGEAAAVTTSTPNPKVHAHSGQHKAKDLRQATRAKNPFAAHPAATHWQGETYFANLRNDLRDGLKVLRTLAPAITFFGGARIQPDDPIFALALQLGRRLAAVGVPPRTGAGPGIMTSVPQGYLAALTQDHAEPQAHAKPLAGGISPDADPQDLSTQGFNIVLPFEQKLSPVIQKAASIREFPYRKLMLYENARGLVTFPGGFGTLDELFEIWTEAARGRHHDPMALVGKSFWQPLLSALETVAVKDRQLISPAAWQRMLVSDDADAIISHLVETEGVEGFDEPPDQLAARMSFELRQAEKVLAKLPAAVTFIGGRGLDASDPTLPILEQAAKNATESHVPLRLAGIAAVGHAVARGVKSADPQARVQGFKLGEDDSPPLDGVDVHLTVSDLIVEKELVSRTTRALVAAPGGLGTLSKVFTLLCEIQCHKRPKIPVVLVGRSYWQPLFDALKKSMLDDAAYRVDGVPKARHTIAPQDLDLVTITDDPNEVAALICGRDAIAEV